LYLFELETERTHVVNIGKNTDETDDQRKRHQKIALPIFQHIIQS